MIDRIKKRQSGLELLRIFCMLFIVSLHYISQSGARSTIPWGWNYIFTIVTGEAGRLGVTCFFMITAWFLCDSKFDVMRIVKILLEVWFYEAVIGAVAVVRWGVSVKEALYQLIPFYGSTYWFANTYILLLLFSPFLNVFIQKCPRKIFKMYILIFFVLGLLMPTLYYNHGGPLTGNEFYVFVYLFIGYIKKYSIDIFKSRKVILLTLIVGYAFICIPFFVWRVMPAEEAAIFNADYYAGMLWTLPNFACAFALFTFFRGLRFHNRYINFIAQATFAVYLIQNNPYINQRLWNNFFHADQYFESNMWSLYSVFVVGSVYVVCTIIDLIRIYFVEIPLISLPWAKKFQNMVNKHFVVESQKEDKRNVMKGEKTDEKVD